MSILAASLWLGGCSAPKARTAGAPPAVPVSVAVAVQEPVPFEIHAVGTVEPFSSVQVKSQIAGELMSVHFVEGGDVRKGDLLFEIDPRPYQEALRQAEAAVSKDLAQLQQAEANLARDRAQLKNAGADAERYQELSKEGLAPRQQYDQYRTNADVLQEAIRADQAAIASARAALESDRAAVGRARLELAYCKIRSPLSGRVGNLLVHPGNLVKENGDNALVVINQISPIFVSFGVPERQLPAIRRKSANQKLPVQVSLKNDSSKVERGVLTVIDNTVDSNTGTIRLKATFNNKGHLLWPGQFVDVVLTLDTQKATLVPAEAVQAGQQGQFIYVVKTDQTVDSREVTLGETVKGMTIVESGVAPGETVVTDGQLRLYPGARIHAVPAAKIDSQTL